MTTTSTTRRHFLAGTALAAAGTAGLGACADTPSSGPHTVRFWGQGAADKDKDEAVRDAFKKTDAGKDAEIYIDQVPSNGVSDMSQIITAVRGGTAPDLWFMDRFNAVQNASIDLLEPLDPLIEKYEDVSPEEFKKQWLQFAMDELTYDGKLYGFPATTDARAIEYNEDLLRDNGIDLDLFDPDQHVLTWDEIADVAEKLTKEDKKGNYKVLGFAPWMDEAWAYTWAGAFGAEGYDNDTSTVTLDTPEWKSVFEVFADWAEKYPYGKVDAFYATYQPPNAPPSQTARFSGRLGMSVAVTSNIQNNLKYAKDVPLKHTWLPVVKDGDDPYTWSGGHSIVVPRGANMTRTLWEFMKFYAGVPGQSIIIPKVGVLPTNMEALEKKKYNHDHEIEVYKSMLQYSTCRPPLPVGSAMWDALARTRDSVPLGSTTPEAAIKSNQDYVEPKMDLFPGYKMPDTYGEPIEVPGS
jgi:multiple sugar transport system substrate-binding protein